MGNSGDGNTGDISFHTISSGIVGTPLEWLRMKSNGNIGIGTANPGRKLEVLASNGEALRLYRNANTVGWGVNMTFAFNNSSNAQVDYAGLHGLVEANTAAAEQGALLFTTATSGALTEKMRISANGNVGIGTTAPTSKLHIVSGTDSPNTLLALDTGVHGGSQFQIGGTINNESYFNLNVYRAGLYFTRLSVNQFGNLLLQPAGDGNVGIGIATPGSKLHVAGEIRSSSGGFRFPDGTVQTTAATGSGGGTISGVSAGTGLSGGGTSGTVTLTNSVPGTSQSIFKDSDNAAGST